MFTLRLTLGLVIIGISSVAYAWSGLSVWEKNKDSAYGVEGYIKSIGINDEENIVHIKFKPRHHREETRTVRVCLNDFGNDLRLFQQSQKLGLLREAFSNDLLVRIGFNGAFDRCVSAVTLIDGSSAIPAKASVSSSGDESI